MPETLLAARTDLRTRLNEANPAFFTNTQLNSYLNEGCRELARRARCLQEKVTIPVYGGNQLYQGPTNIIAVHRAEYMPAGSVNTYPLDIKNYNEMDAIWGSNQNIQQWYPAYLTTWREPPNTNLVLYPVPSSAGTLVVFYARVATPAPTDSSNLDCPEGWWDLVILYALYKALFQTLDPRWKEVRDEFNQELMELIDAAQGYTDSTGSVSTPSGIGPLWQFGGGMDQGWY